MSNLLKRSYILCNEDEKRIIDSNELVADRIEELAKTLRNSDDGRDFSSDGFSEGLDAQTVDALLSDNDDNSADPGSNVIKGSAGIEDAQEDAKRIIDEAKEQASGILEDARSQAEAEKADIYAEAKKAGHDDGYADGMAEVESMKAGFEKKSQELEDEYNRKCEKLEPMFIDTLTDIYEHIFHIRFGDSKEIIFYLIQDAVRKVDSNTNFIIHVSKDDYGFVSMQKKELLAGLSSADNAEIVEDMTLKANECFIETGAGIFDCSLETQLAGLKRELRLLSYHKGSNADGTGN